MDKPDQNSILEAIKNGLYKIAKAADFPDPEDLAESKYQHMLSHFSNDTIWELLNTLRKGGLSIDDIAYYIIGYDFGCSTENIIAEFAAISEIEDIPPERIN